MNKSQKIGIGILIVGIIAYLLVDNSIIQTTSGVLCAIGLGLICKWIPSFLYLSLNATKRYTNTL